MTIVKTTIASNNFKKNEYISFIVKMKKLFMKSKNFMLHLLKVKYIINGLIYQWKNQKKQCLKINLTCFGENIKIDILNIKYMENIIITGEKT